MRITASLIAVSALAWAHAATAQTLEPAAFSPEFSRALANDYGEREGVYLRQAVDRAVARAFARRGLSVEPGRIEIAILDARPNRPTFKQLSQRPGLDYLRSISVGGATLQASVQGPGGAPIDVRHRYYTRDIFEARYSATTWSDAHRSIDRFAERVADAYTGAAG